jgi:hypothetical protein
MKQLINNLKKEIKDLSFVSLLMVFVYALFLVSSNLAYIGQGNGKYF